MTFFPDVSSFATQLITDVSFGTFQGPTLQSFPLQTPIYRG